MAASSTDTSLERNDFTPSISTMPPRPEVTYNWINITSEFFHATKDLQLGELLHDDIFGLFEAMSAIEMMDPKMDAGMMCNRGKKVLNFDQAVKAGALKLNNLTMEELVGIMDSMLACLVTWLEGHSAAQTILTCLYLHKPLSIEDRALRAFSIQTLKLIAIINNIVHSAGVFEEEDFQPALYGYGVCSEVSEVRAGGMMREVEEELQRAVKATRNRQGEPWDPKMQKQHEDAVALFSRIRFMRLFYAALAAIMRREQVSIPEAERCLVSCNELVCIMQNTIGRGLRPKQPKDEEGNKVDYPVIMGFEPLVNQRLLPPTFPRYTRLRTRKEAMNYLEEMVGRLRHITKITHCTTFHTALEFIEHFSESRPCVLSRSLAQVLYLGGDKLWGGQGMAEALREAARSFICPPALLPKAPVMSNVQAKDYVDSFFNRCVRPFEQLIQTCGHNRARQRDKVAHLLEEFAMLQDEADKVDAYLHNVLLKSDQPRPHLAYLGTWVLYHTLRLMIKYLLTGFTLELYAVHEYHYVYWYLYEFVYVWLVSALSRADAMLLEQDGYDTNKGGKSGRSSKNKNRNKKKHRPYGKEITYNQALQHLCGGYYKAMLGLREAGKVKLPLQEFDSEQVRYEHRFLPFSVVMTPPPVHYDQFLSMTDLSNFPQPVSPATLYHDARNHFFKARSLLETIHAHNTEVQQLLKVVKTNFVVMKLLEGGHKADDPTRPQFDFTTHPCFPIIKI
ncbi:N-alpha-acetyltransferase 35, NatC auxiliary subunit-like isoform X2 [Homarus americanus]|uniref:N-alpha-acetyltransferase 35, NatC auxiliary subunit-like isoform X2 n=1 Tax=Homarus americanus TaxID=6706 RepID=UPI001C472FFA|nr:N-alpha-acetyltransferase 35, NatC auxiliary subunit-like isoform X2 [Homarus americanus]